MLSRLANVKRVVHVTAIAALLTTLGWAVGSATAEATPHGDPRPGNAAAHEEPDNENPANGHSAVSEFRGLLIFKNGLPVGFIPPGADHVDVVHLLVQCNAHQRQVERNPEGIGILHCP
jgi:hypothetical protein